MSPSLGRVVYVCRMPFTHLILNLNTDCSLYVLLLIMDIMLTDYYFERFRQIKKPFYIPLSTVYPTTGFNQRLCFWLNTSIVYHHYHIITPQVIFIYVYYFSGFSCLPVMIINILITKERPIELYGRIVDIFSIKFENLCLIQNIYCYKEKYKISNRFEFILQSKHENLQVSRGNR